MDVSDDSFTIDQAIDKYRRLIANDWHLLEQEYTVCV